MASGREAGWCIRGKGYGHCIAEAEVEVKTEECCQSCNGCCEGKVLLCEFLKNKSFRGEAGKRRETPKR